MIDRREFLALLSSLACLRPCSAASHRLLELDEQVSQGAYPGIDGLVVIQNGQILVSGTYPPRWPKLVGSPGMFNYSDPDWHPIRNQLHTMQSITKSVLSALVGIALDRGDLESLQQCVSPFFQRLHWRPISLCTIS